MAVFSDFSEQQLELVRELNAVICITQNTCASIDMDNAFAWSDERMADIADLLTYIASNDEDRFITGAETELIYEEAVAMYELAKQFVGGDTTVLKITYDRYRAVIENIRTNGYTYGDERLKRIKLVAKSASARIMFSDYGVLYRDTWYRVSGASAVAELLRFVAKNRINGLVCDWQYELARNGFYYRTIFKCNKDLLYNPSDFGNYSYMLLSELEEQLGLLRHICEKHWVEIIAKELDGK